MFESWTWEMGLCDFCYHKLDETARAKVPEIFEPGHWGVTGGNKPEEAKKWRQALEEAQKELTTLCLRLDGTDWDHGTICLDCLNKIMKEKPEEA